MSKNEEEQLNTELISSVEDNAGIIEKCSKCWRMKRNNWAFHCWRLYRQLSRGLLCTERASKIYNGCTCDSLSTNTKCTGRTWTWLQHYSLLATDFQQFCLHLSHLICSAPKLCNLRCLIGLHLQRLNIWNGGCGYNCVVGHSFVGSIPRIFQPLILWQIIQPFQLCDLGSSLVLVSEANLNGFESIASPCQAQPSPTLGLHSQGSQQSTRTRMLGGNYLRQALCCSDPFKAFEYVPALMNGFPMQARARQGKGAQTQRCLPGSPYAGAVEKSVSKILNKKTPAAVAESFGHRGVPRAFLLMWRGRKCRRLSALSENVQWGKWELSKGWPSFNSN